MQASQGQLGMGFQFLIGDGASPEVFTPMAELTSMSAPNLSRDAVELTNTDSVQQFREFVPGLKNGGTVDIAGNLLKEQITKALAEYAKSGRTNYRITLPTDVASTLDLNGFMTDFSTDEPIDDRMTFTASFQISGPVTLS